MGAIKDVYQIAENSLEEIKDSIKKKKLSPEEKIEFFEQFKDDIVEMIDIKIEKLKILKEEF